MSTQKHIRRIVIGILFLCFSICTFVVQQYLFTMLLGASAYWIILSGIFDTFPDTPDPETGHPSKSKRWIIIGSALFLILAVVTAFALFLQESPHKTAEDIQLAVDRSGDADAGLHQQYISELVTPDEEAETKTDELQQPIDRTQEYILNTNTKVFHLPKCSYVESISDENKEVYTGTRDSVTDMGYAPCGHCNP